MAGFRSLKYSGTSITGPGGLNKGLRRVLCESLVSYTSQRRTLPRNQLSRAFDGFGGLLMDARCLVVAQSALSELKKLHRVSVVGVASARCWTTANTMHTTHRRVQLAWLCVMRLDSGATAAEEAAKDIYIASHLLHESGR
jgi:hypothetical protein